MAAHYHVLCLPSCSYHPSCPLVLDHMSVIFQYPSPKHHSPVCCMEPHNGLSPSCPPHAPLPCDTHAHSLPLDVVCRHIPNVVDCSGGHASLLWQIYRTDNMCCTMQGFSATLQTHAYHTACVLPLGYNPAAPTEEPCSIGRIRAVCAVLLLFLAGRRQYDLSVHPRICGSPFRSRSSSSGGSGIYVAYHLPCHAPSTSMHRNPRGLHHSAYMKTLHPSHDCYTFGGHCFGHRQNNYAAVRTSAILPHI